MTSNVQRHKGLGKKPGTETHGHGKASYRRKKTRRYDFEELRRACSGHWESIIRALSHFDISETIERKKHIRCPPGHGGKTNRQFRVFQDFSQTGGGICNICGAFPDGFALLTYLNGWDRKTAIKEVAQFMENRGYSPAARSEPPPPPPKPTFTVNTDRASALSKVWNSGVPLKGTLGEKYLRRRGITAELPNTGDVRFHPALEYFDYDTGEIVGKFPAIISLLKTSKAGHPVTVHRTYLDPRGGKAKVSSPKKLMPPSIDGAIRELGGAIRLYKLSPMLMAVTEGIETAMAVRSAHPALPVWATYSAGLLKNFQPPSFIKMVHIFGDLDSSGTGQAAAARLALRLNEEGYKARIILPRREVSVPDDGAGWYTSEATRELIVGRLEADGYVIKESCKSMDWLDAWNESHDIVKSALTRRSAR